MLNVTQLRQQHHQMQRLLGILVREAAALGRGGDADLPLMSDVLRYLTEYPDRHHHPVEDLALWRLSERGALARAAAEQLDYEHRAVRYYGGELLQLLEGALGDAFTSRAWIAMAAQQYASELNAHMTHEERDLLPLLEREFAPTDWEGIAQAAAAPADPLFGEHVDARFRHLHSSIAERAGCGCQADPVALPGGSATASELSAAPA